MKLLKKNQKNNFGTSQYILNYMVKINLTIWDGGIIWDGGVYIYFFINGGSIS